MRLEERDEKQKTRREKRKREKNAARLLSEILEKRDFPGNDIKCEAKETKDGSSFSMVVIFDGTDKNGKKQLLYFMFPWDTKSDPAPEFNARAEQKGLDGKYRIPEQKTEEGEDNEAYPEKTET